jgi:MFS family permease
MDRFKDDFSTGFLDKHQQPSMSPKQVSLIVAMLSAGTAVGALLAAPLGDRWGRRLSLIFAIGVFCIGAIFQVSATNVALLVVGRWVYFLVASNPDGVGSPTR